VFAGGDGEGKQSSQAAGLVVGMGADGQDPPGALEGLQEVIGDAVLPHGTCVVPAPERGRRMRPSREAAATDHPVGRCTETKDPARELGERLRNGAVIVEMHDARCRAHTGTSCLVVVVDRDGTRHVFRSDAFDLLAPELRCVCAEYR
jgi:hypothetical protein